MPEPTSNSGSFRLGAIEPRMYASDIVEHLPHSYPAWQYGNIRNERNIAHELIALLPWVASEDP